jgi:hypothetical protein
VEQVLVEACAFVREAFLGFGAAVDPHHEGEGSVAVRAVQEAVHHPAVSGGEVDRLRLDRSTAVSPVGRVSVRYVRASVVRSRTAISAGRVVVSIWRAAFVLLRPGLRRLGRQVAPSCDGRYHDMRALTEHPRSRGTPT